MQNETHGVTPADGLDRGGRWAIVLLSVAVGIGLLLLRQGGEHGWTGLEAPGALLLWYTALLAAPALTVLLMGQSGSRVPWVAGIVWGMVLIPLALHTGHAVVPEIQYGSSAIYFAYWVVISVATFVLAPFVQAARSGRWLFHYPALYEHAWNNALTLAITAVFTAACWLILTLWQGLFGLIGIHLFRDLFGLPEFIYPGTAAFAGIGFVLGRGQVGAVRTLLNVCVTLGRVLFPVIAGVGLLFLAALAFNSLEPLWKTRHAAALMLTLVFVTAFLLNALYQDGARQGSYGIQLRLLTSAALLALPVFVGIAGYALWLRIAQHGWTEERLWGILVAVFAGLYALSYAAAAVVPRPSWLALVGPANSRLALAVVAVLLLTQTTLLDFRAIAVRSQVAAALGPGGDPSKLDLEYLRFRAGRPGNDALRELKHDPRVVANAVMMADIDRVLQRTREFPFTAKGGVVLEESMFTVIPAGTAVPPGLMAALGEPTPQGYWPYNYFSCAQHPGNCVLLQVPLGPGDQAVWTLTQACDPCRLPVFGQEGLGWRYLGVLYAPKIDGQKLIAELKDQHYAAAASPWKDLVVGGAEVHYRFEPK